MNGVGECVVDEGFCEGDYGLVGGDEIVGIDCGGEEGVVVEGGDLVEF